jgi:HK97 family phage major capsid protein
MANGIMSEAAGIARKRYGDDSNAHGVLKSLAERGDKLSVEKSNVLAGATVSGNWAADLVGDETSAIADFVAYLRPRTILGRFGQDGIPALRSVPFRVPLVTQTAKGAGYWVGEGKPKPLTSWSYSRTTLTPLKVANIAVLTEELIRDSSPAADMLVRDELVEALRERLDTDFIDPAKAASSGVSPASITNGAPHGAGSGTGDADDVRADIRSLLNEYITANNPPTSGVLLMRSGLALALSLMTNALGQREFADITMNGGVLLGIPVITSEYVPAGVVVMVNANDIYFADEGGFSIDLSREASLQMLDNPTNDSVTPTATSLVSMFQTNSVAFRAERALNWARRRSTAVAYLTGVAWGGSVNDLS